MDENIRKLKELVDGSDNIVFFGGAGSSLNKAHYFSDSHSDKETVYQIAGALRRNLIQETECFLLCFDKFA